MAIDSLMMAASIGASIALPVILRGCGLGGAAAGFLALAAATLVTHGLPYLVHPEPHYAPAYAVAIGMYLMLDCCIILAVLGCLSGWESRRRG